MRGARFLDELYIVAVGQECVDSDIFMSFQDNVVSRQFSGGLSAPLH